MKIHIRGPIFPTEDRNLVVEAISNLFPEIILETSQFDNVNWLESITEKRYILTNLREMIHETRIIDATRKVLQSSWTGTMSTIKFDKQAAYRNKIKIVDPEDDIPLGAIEVVIMLDNIEILNEFLLWLTPPTKDGRILRN